MTWPDHARRALTVLLVAVCLVTVPAIATAKFTGRATVGLTASTASLVSPTSVTGTFHCLSNGTNRIGVDLTVSGFTDAGPAGATYELSLLIGSSVVDSVKGASRSATLRVGPTDVNGTGSTWTLRIRSVLGSWTGPTYDRQISCSSTTGGNQPL